MEPGIQFKRQRSESRQAVTTTIRCDSQNSRSEFNSNINWNETIRLKFTTWFVASLNWEMHQRWRTILSWVIITFDFLNKKYLYVTKCDDEHDVEREFSLETFLILASWDTLYLMRDSTLFHRQKTYCRNKLFQQALPIVVFVCRRKKEEGKNLTKRFKRQRGQWE